MNIEIEVNEHRRKIGTDGFKIYGSDAELRQIRNAIEKALNAGLIQGWVGVGIVDDPKTVFPFNGRPDVPTTAWRDDKTLITTPAP